jgi:hypothetical protein
MQIHRITSTGTAPALTPPSSAPRGAIDAQLLRRNQKILYILPVDV